jgi:hypothetical protein
VLIVDRRDHAGHRRIRDALGMNREVERIPAASSSP